MAEENGINPMDINNHVVVEKDLTIHIPPKVFFKRDHKILPCTFQVFNFNISFVKLF